MQRIFQKIKWNGYEKIKQTNAMDLEITLTWSLIQKKKIETNAMV